MSEGDNPYGDGRASERIVDGLVRWFHGERPVLEDWKQFHGAARAAEQIEVLT